MRRQHGVVSRAQLLALGYSPSAIEHRLRTGRLRPAARGVYLVGWDQTTAERRWTVAILACMPAACLSHGSAAAIWRIGAERPGAVEVSIRRRAQVVRPGIRVHCRPAMGPDRVGVVNEVPVTTPIQTLVDLATELPDSRLERAVNDADKHGLVDPEALRVSLDGHPGEPGVKRLRALLDRDTFRLSDDELERLFRPIAAAAGLPVPRTKV